MTALAYLGTTSKKNTHTHTRDSEPVVSNALPEKRPNNHQQLDWTPANLPQPSTKRKPHVAKGSNPDRSEGRLPPAGAQHR